MVFGERRKRENPEKNLSEQSREPTNSIHILRWVRQSNPGNIGGRQVLSPPRQPCSLSENQRVLKTFPVFESRVGELGAVFREGEISTLIVLIFRFLRFSTANTTARCHTSKTRVLTSCNFFSRIFYCSRHTLSIIHVVYNVILTR